MDTGLDIGLYQLTEPEQNTPMGFRNDVHTGQYQQDNDQGACKAHYTFRSHNYLLLRTVVSCLLRSS